MWIAGEFSYVIMINYFCGFSEYTLCGMHKHVYISFSFYRFQDIQVTFNEVTSTFLRVITQFRNNAPINRQLLHKLLTLLFYTAAKYKESAAMTTEADETIDKLFKEVYKSISEYWIVMHYSEVFGKLSYHKDIEVLYIKT